MLQNSNFPKLIMWKPLYLLQSKKKVKTHPLYFNHFLVIVYQISSCSHLGVLCLSTVYLYIFLPPNHPFQWTHKDRNTAFIRDMCWLFYQRCAKTQQEATIEGRVCAGLWLESLVHHRGENVTAQGVTVSWAHSLTPRWTRQQTLSKMGRGYEPEGPPSKIYFLPTGSTS